MNQKLNKRLTVVVPVFNEADGIDYFVKMLLYELDKLVLDADVILVNDGSQDKTADFIDAIQKSFPTRVSVIHFSRNFGHQAALTAGMDEATGDAVITMDADLQHPPSLIPLMVERWLDGMDIVQTIRKDSSETNYIKRLTSKYFYEIINIFSATRIEPSAADFRLISRTVVDIFKNDLRERDRFLRGLIAWVGFRTSFITFTPPPRFAGNSKYSFKKMLSFARVGLISFSRVPLKISVWVGLIFAVFSLLYGSYAVFAYFYIPERLNPGWASIVVTMTFLGGCQMLFIGLIGEYIATIFDEIKNRPIYITSRKSLKKSNNPENNILS